MMVAMVTMLLLESHLFSFRFFYNEMVAPYLCFDGPVPNQLYVIGGRDNNQEPLDVVEMFDTWNGRPGQVPSKLWLRWVTCPDMLAKRAGCASAPLPNGCLLVCGGYDKRGIVSGVLDSCEAGHFATNQTNK